jgi:hypothetical protein
MLKVIHGPTYQYQGERLDVPTKIIVQDHCYNETTQTFPLQDLLDNSTCNPAHHTLVFDHVLQQDEFAQYQCLYMPSLLAREALEFMEQSISPNWNSKKYAFNFMINKPRSHREQLLQLIDQYNLTSFSHSLCWKNSPVDRIPVTNYRIGEEVQLDQGIKNRSYRNSTTYQVLLQQKIFEPTCVSLITEPAYTEQQTIVTEKTIMAIYGGTIPIWVGGWRIADYMRNQGFDVFDDVVNHSYQRLSDPAQRVAQAVASNLDLLREPDLDFFDRYQHRLRHNYNLARSGIWQQQCDTICNFLGIDLDYHTS